MGGSWQVLRERPVCPRVLRVLSPGSSPGSVPGFCPRVLGDQNFASVFSEFETKCARQGLTSPMTPTKSAPGCDGKTVERKMGLQQHSHDYVRRARHAHS